MPIALMDMYTRIAVVALTAASAVSGLMGQSFPDGHLDPTRSVEPSVQPKRAPLPEEYIWTAGDVTARRADRSKYPWNRTELRAEPHFFRRRFQMDHVPTAATLYVAGPRAARVYLNGQLIGDFTSNTDAPINFRVFHADATRALRVGENVLAIEAVRGRGVVTGVGPVTTQQLAYGEVLVAKVVPAGFGVEAAADVFTDSRWRSSAVRSEGWEQERFDDSGWAAADSLGAVESNIDFFQWSADAGMYGWPGYMGMSPWLRTYRLEPQAVSHIYAGHAQLHNVDSLTAEAGDRFAVSFLQESSEADPPTLLLDFGREVAGRVIVESACDCVATVSVAYGESEIEAMSTGFTTGQQGGNYLGTNVLDVPARGVVRGPKSAFRYVRIAFLHGAPVTAFRSIRVEGIYTPVQYVGSFESSDPLLNRIWETGAYTAHLCMQDDIWDGPKRDRGRWVGDLDIEGRTILTAFGDDSLIKDTLDRLAESTSAGKYVNGITGYSALWVTSLEYLYRHTGDKTFLASQREHLIRILSGMDQSLSADGLFTDPHHPWLFVDWAPGMYGNTAEALTGTRLQYVRAYHDAGDLFAALGDQELSKKYLAQYKRADAATVAASLDHSSGTFGRSWQLNALAELSVSDSAMDKSAIKRDVLLHVRQDSPGDPVISPYFNAYLLDAMANAGLTREALEWMRQYWGGMLAEGATSFWESYDLRWPKNNYHLSLQADGTSGYFVSLAHGWSSGPTAFLSEKVLGVEPSVSGDGTYSVSPNLAGLAWVRGLVPTPHGAIRVEVAKGGPIVVDVPAGIVVTITVPMPSAQSRVYINGALASGVKVDADQRSFLVRIDQAGHYAVSSK
jgi:alpha-L-rhamnosidase